ncbi:MAG: glycosyltransferase family 2 protein [Pseudomonadota bacterium]|jgi:glycosyltransferase involved in cell wall biosynthesis
MPESLSVVIITRNAAARLEPCLQSCAFASEIVIVDSGSQDATLDIARRFNARVVQQDWLGFGKQKQFAVAQANHDWVLCVDADERVSDALRAGILNELEAPRFQAYEFARCNRFLGRWLRHGEGYPDLSLRLFDRRHANWSDDPIHEKVVTDAPVGRLEGDLLHESEQGIADYLAKQNRYTSLQAEQMYARGKRAGAGKLLLSPLFRFIKFYFLRLGFLDGVPGLVHVLIGCFNSFSKYAKLRELTRR